MVQFNRRAACTAMLAGFSIPSAFPATFPEKPITLLVPYPAGGPADNVARWLEPHLRRELGQAVLVDNVSGASGTLGVNRLLNGPSDGHQMMVGSPSEIVLAPLALASAKYKAADLRMLAEVARTNLVLVSRKDLGLSSIGQLIARLQDGSLRELAYGSFGLGSINHFMFEDLRMQVGCKATHVPYRGAPPMIQDLIGGQIDLAFVPLLTSTLEFIKAGKLSAVMTTSVTRDRVLPNVPSATEASELKEFEYAIWAGVFVSHKTPEATAATLLAAVNAALKDPQYRAAVEVSGAVVPPPQTPHSASRFYHAETQRYTRIAKAIRLEPQ